MNSTPILSKSQFESKSHEFYDSGGCTYFWPCSSPRKMDFRWAFSTLASGVMKKLYTPAPVQNNTAKTITPITGYACKKHKQTSKK